MSYGSSISGQPGVTEIDSTARALVLTVGQIQTGIIRHVGTFVGTRAVTFPAVHDTQTYTRAIVNDSMDTDITVDVAGGSAPVTIVGGSNKTVAFGATRAYEV